MNGETCRTNPDLPDVSDGACCIGSAVHGPGACTCWEPVLPAVQQQPRVDLDHDVMPRMCGDCAYRPTSPERSGNPRAGADTEALMEIAAVSRFWCHDGMQLPTAYRHGPTGAQIPGSPLDYSNAPVVDGRPYRIDGRPASLCAGWAAHRRRIDHEVTRELKDEVARELAALDAAAQGTAGTTS